jgi:hypothetical protein
MGNEVNELFEKYANFFIGVVMYHWINHENLKLPPEMMLMICKIIGKHKELELKAFWYCAKQYCCNNCSSELDPHGNRIECLNCQRYYCLCCSHCLQYNWHYLPIFCNKCR